MHDSIIFHGSHTVSLDGGQEIARARARCQGANQRAACDGNRTWDAIGPQKNLEARWRFAGVWWCVERDRVERANGTKRCRLVFGDVRGAPDIEVNDHDGVTRAQARRARMLWVAEACYLVDGHLSVDAEERIEAVRRVSDAAQILDLCDRTALYVHRLEVDRAQAYVDRLRANVDAYYAPPVDGLDNAYPSFCAKQAAIWDEVKNQASHEVQLHIKRILRVSYPRERAILSTHVEGGL